MTKYLLLAFLTAGLFVAQPVRAQLFSDDFGTSFTTISTTNWPTAYRGGSPSAYNVSIGACANTSDRGAYLYSSGQFYTTLGIAIPAGGAELTFEYSYASFSSYSTIQIATSALGTYNTVRTLSYTGSSICSPETVDLSSYAGSTVYIRFRANSSTSFYFDDVQVTASGGGGGGCEFSEEFGTSFTSMFTNADWPCKHSSASSYNTSGGSCAGTGDYSAALNGFGYYYSTRGINIPSTGYTLEFNYAFNYSFSFPEIKVATSSSCAASFTTIATLSSTSGACSSESINLDAYSGQTIYIRFESRTSSATFYFDDVEVCGGGGSSGGGTCDLLSHDGTTTSGLNTSGIGTNQGSTIACTAGDYALYTSGSNPFIATQDIAVPQGKGVSLEFTAKKYSGYSGTGEIWVHIGGYCSFQVYTVPFNTNGWVQIGTFNPATSCSSFGPYTVPSDVVGGQLISFCIVPRNASSFNWVSVDNICVSEEAGAAVPTTLEEDFGTNANGWYPQSGYVDIPYHTYKSASDAYVYLFTGVDGGTDKAAYFYTGFDFCSTVSGVGIVTREINTNGYSNGQISLSFRSQYPCGGSVSYTFDEDYTTYSPRVYIMEGADHGVNSWVQLPVNYYFADYQWQRATFDISDYKNDNVRIKIERGGFCSTQLEAVDNIRISDRNCTISKLSTGPISGPGSISANTDYSYSLASVTGAGYYKWFVRNDGDLYSSAPYIVSGQGTNSVTINFGILSSPLRVLCIPFDTDPALNEDACYAKISYLTTNLVVCTTYVWEGGTSEDWFTEDNWDCENVPDENADVIIPDVSAGSNRYPQIVGPAIAKARDLDLQANASVTVSNLNNGKLEIYGDLTSNGTWLGTGTLSFEKAGTQTLTGDVSFRGIVAVQSGATLNTNNVLTLESNGSLLHGTGTPGGEGTVTGNVTVRRNSGNNNTTAYNYWSSPVENPSVSVLGNNLYYYLPGNALDLTEYGLRQAWVPASGPMQAGKGYISTAGGEVAFYGTANNAPTGADITITIEKVPALNGQYNGWNLVGNPFPCALDAGLFQQQNAGAITGALYFWEDDYSGGSGWTSAQDYAVYNIVGITPRFDPSDQNGVSFNGYIASGQSFFVEKISNGTGQVLFSNAMRSGANNDKFFKQGGMNKMWLGIFNPNGIYNETLIAFGEDATDSLDIHLDAPKMKGNSEIAFGTELDGKFYAIQAYAPITFDKVVPLSLDATKNGQYEIKLMHLENFDETISLILEDRQDSMFHNLRLDSSYFFQANGGMDSNRFYLRFTPPLEINITEEGCSGMDGVISLHHQGANSWDLSLRDGQGNLIASNTNILGTVDIAGLEGGIYLLTLEDAYGYQVTREIGIGSLKKVMTDFEVDSEVGIGVPVYFHNTSQGGDYFEWQFGDGASLQNIKDAVHVYNTQGVYQVHLKAYNDDCVGETSKNIKVFDTGTSVESISKPAVDIWTNGNYLFLTFENWNNEQAEVLLFDKLGRNLSSLPIRSMDKQVIEFNNIASGFYFVRVNSGNFSISKKVFLTP